MAGIRGYFNNQEIGKTDVRGNLLVPNLLPHYGNQLSIAEHDLPLDHNVGDNRRLIAPPYRGGAIVRFSAQPIQSVSGTIIIEEVKGTIIPAYGELTVMKESQQVTSPIGSEGEFYLENLATGTYAAEVEYAQGRCQFTLQVPVSEQPFLELEPVRCHVVPKE